MNFEDYIEKLSNDQSEMEYLELSKEGEIDYLKNHEYRFKQILNSIGSTSEPIKILDIGTTPFTLFIKEVYPHHLVSTLDRTDLMKKRCAAKNIEFHNLDLDNSQIPFEDDLFDIIIFTEVLEHIFRPPSVILKEINRILGKNGTLLLGVPNIAELQKRIKLLFGVSPLEHPDQQLNKDWVHGHGHIHEYTLNEIVSLLVNSKFKISKKGYLSPSISSTYKHSNRNVIGKTVMAAYLAVLNVVPSFRKVIFVECKK